MEKAYPTLQDEAWVQMALTHYLRQLDHPTIAFNVKQRRSNTLDETVSATLEMESYLMSSSQAAAGVSTVEPLQETEEATVAVVGSSQQHSIDDLISHLERIEHKLA